MVLKKDSSVLGYPGEISKARDANNHGVAKFDCPSDPKYITVPNVLRSVMTKIVASRMSSRVFDIRALFCAILFQEHPDTDCVFFQDQ